MPGPVQRQEGRLVGASSDTPGQFRPILGTRQPENQVQKVKVQVVHGIALQKDREVGQMLVTAQDVGQVGGAFIAPSGPEIRPLDAPNGAELPAESARIPAGATLLVDQEPLKLKTMEERLLTRLETSRNSLSTALLRAAYASLAARLSPLGSAPPPHPACRL